MHYTELGEVQLNWIPSKNTQKINSQQIRRAMTLSRPPLESSQREESKSALTIFVKFIFDLLFQNNVPNIAQRKIVKADLDSRRRIL